MKILKQLMLVAVMSVVPGQLFSAMKVVTATGRVLVHPATIFGALGVAGNMYAARQKKQADHLAGIEKIEKLEDLFYPEKVFVSENMKKIQHSVLSCAGKGVSIAAFVMAANIMGMSLFARYGLLPKLHNASATAALAIALGAGGTTQFFSLLYSVLAYVRTIQTINLAHGCKEEQFSKNPETAKIQKDLGLPHDETTWRAKHDLIDAIIKRYRRFILQKRAQQEKKEFKEESDFEYGKVKGPLMFVLYWPVIGVSKSAQLIQKFLPKNYSVEQATELARRGMLGSLEIAALATAYLMCARV